MYMVFLVIHDRRQTDAVMAEWTKAGIRGATLFDSVGAYRRRKRIPGRFAYTTSYSDDINQTITAIVSDEETALRALSATEKILGDLNNPETGIFTYWPLAAVKGIQKNYTPDDDERARR